MVNENKLLHKRSSDLKEQGEIILKSLRKLDVHCLVGGQVHVHWLMVG